MVGSSFEASTFETDKLMRETSDMVPFDVLSCVDDGVEFTSVENRVGIHGRPTALYVH